MELALLLRMFMRRWYAIVIPVIVAAILVIPGMLSSPSTASFSVSIRYTAAQILEAIPNRDGDYQDVWLASELTVNAFTDWVRGSRFSDAVLRRVAVEGAPLNAESISISAQNEKSVGQISLNWPDSTELESITAALVSVLTEENSVIFPQLGGVNAQVELLDDPQIVAAPAPLTNRLGGLLRIGLALVLGLILAAALDWLDPVIRRREQVESAAMRVLTAIPRD
jgi:capsular polysaccharide biosynthesis protein